MCIQVWYEQIDRACYRSSFHSNTHPLPPPSLPSSLPPFYKSTGFLGKYLQFELGKVGYRLYLANRGDEQDVRPFKVAFDLGQVWREGGEDGREGGSVMVRTRIACERCVELYYQTC